MISAGNGAKTTNIAHAVGCLLPCRSACIQIAPPRIPSKATTTTISPLLRCSTAGNPTQPVYRTRMERVRVDKWLWAARFYKTRSAATDAVNGGLVQVGGERVKPAREVRPGDVVEVRTGAVRRTVVVQALAERRGSATIA